MGDNVSAPLPDLTPEPSAIYTVTLDDPAAVITSLVVHFSQAVPEDAVTIRDFRPAFVYSETGQ